ncbi:MAG: 1,2-phenylacetyl-CoA epoxidase subunit PaaC, partial [Geminicoccaceae bacterium]
MSDAGAGRLRGVQPKPGDTRRDEVQVNELLAAVVGLGDDHLILGHRLSEWCGHAPMLEEDLALPNMGLDMLGQARALYVYGAKIEGRGRSEDDFAYLRMDRAYMNCLLVERPNGDFAHTMLRQLYFAAFMEPFWQAATESTDDTLRGIAGKAVKEVAYHIRHAGEWVVRLGDGTEESARRMGEAVQALHPYTDELFLPLPGAVEVGIFPDREGMRQPWEATIRAVFEEAGLEIP